MLVILSALPYNEIFGDFSEGTESSFLRIQATLELRSCESLIRVVLAQVLGTSYGRIAARDIIFMLNGTMEYK